MDNIWSIILSHLPSLLLVFFFLIILIGYKSRMHFKHQWGRPISTRQNTRKIKRYETALIAIFTNPDPTFDMKDNKFTVHLLHKNHIRFAELKFDLSDADTRKDCFGNQYIRLFYVISDRKSMPFITRLRATHQSPTDKIFFEGIEVWEFTTNRRIFYSVKQDIKGGIGINETNRICTKPQTLSLWSKQTFCVSFEDPMIYEFGKEVVPNTDKKRAESIYGEEVYGVLIPCKLDWYETVIFYGFLFCSMFTFDVSILVFMFETLYPHTIWIIGGAIILLSGAPALAATELLAYFFSNIKSKYEESESQIARLKRRKNNSLPNVWPFGRCLCLFFVILFSFGLLVLTQIELYQIESSSKNTIAKRYGIGLTQTHWIDESIVFIVILVFSIVFSFPLWVFLFGLIRYFLRYLTFSPKFPKTETSGANSPDISEDTVFNRKIISTIRRSRHRRDTARKDEKNIDQSSVESSTQSEIEKSKSKVIGKTDKTSKDSTNVKKNVIPGTEQLEKEMSDENRKKQLMTKSVIHSSTKSKGFISPEEFRVTESKV